MILLKYLLLFSALFLAFKLSSCRESPLVGDPIAIYLSWAKNPDTTMVVQWVAPFRGFSKVVYRKKKAEERLETFGFSQPLPQGHREQHVHVVELTELSPSTIYEFSIDEKVWHAFKTMPSDLNEPIRFVVGGDMYHEAEDRLEKANRLAAAHNPAFVIAGGDLAYAAPKIGNSEDSARWMTFISRWYKDMVTEEGLMIPLLTAIGNHEVIGRYRQPKSHAPFYYALFSTSKGYDIIDFGDYLSIVLLDTEHTNLIEGKQTDWLREKLAERAHIPHKFAAYHVPAWPSVRCLNAKRSQLIRSAWVPLFEQFKINLSFEHHEHSYKRTFAIKENQIDPQGVVYLGDGAWGCTPRNPCTPAERWYLEKSSQSQHILLVEISKEKRSVTAIDVPTLQTIDYFQQPTA